MEDRENVLASITRKYLKRYRLGSDKGPSLAEVYKQTKKLTIEKAFYHRNSQETGMHCATHLPWSSSGGYTRRSVFRYHTDEMDTQTRPETQ